MNVPEFCSKAAAIAHTVFSDYNPVAIMRKTKISNAGSGIKYRSSYKGFNQELFVEEIKKVCNG